MTTTRVIIHNDDPAPLLARLAANGADVDARTCDSYAGLASQLEAFRPDAVYSVRFAGSADYPADALKSALGPKWLAVGGSGTDHLGGWDPAQLTVTNSAGVAADMMAEYVFGSFLHFTLDVAGLEADRKSRRWASRSVRPLAGQTLLIVGLGKTGQAIARKAKAFDLNVIGVRANPVATENVDEVFATSDLAEIVPRADFIVVCVPLLPTTKALIGAAQFNLMKSDCVLVDISRGGIVDQQALAITLERGQLAGAALDVFEVEPLPESSPLWDLSNVLISPHCSSVYPGWDLRSVDMFCENLKRWQNGQPLNNVVDPARGY